MPFKIYVDSRFRVDKNGADSDTDFSIELPHPLQVKGRAFVDVCLVPNTFFTIREGENDRLHVVEDVNNQPYFRIAVIAPGQYNAITLKDALVEALNFARVIGGQYTVTYDVPTNKLHINNLDSTDTFAIYPTTWLKENAGLWNGVAPANKQINANDLRDAGAVTGFTLGAILQQSGPQVLVKATEAVNTQPYGQLFLRSSLGDGYSAIGPDGSSDIIRRIVMPTSLNNLTIDQHGLPHDSVPVGNNGELTSLSFRLTDVFGRTVDTNGHAISFSIIFIHDGE